MALDTFAPSVSPSPGGSITPAVKILDADFGDGYSQPAPDGINSIRDTKALIWDGLTTAQMQEIMGFFRAKLGTTPFYYQPFGYSSAQKWTCSDFSCSDSGGIWSVNAKLLQSFTNEV